MKMAKQEAKQEAEQALADNPVGSRAKSLELDLRQRDFEISQLTQRNNFFMVFQGVLIAGLVQSQGTAAPLITFGMSLLGVATSIFQIGMAGGAKYWQSRWEAATRSSELAIVLELLAKERLAVQTFTLDPAVLTEEERGQIERWNIECRDDSRIINDPNFIRQVVLTDIRSGSSGKIRKTLDGWVRRFAIAPKWSVSRIPIWVGATLLVFWFVIASHSVRIPGLDVYSYLPT